MNPPTDATPAAVESANSQEQAHAWAEFRAAAVRSTGPWRLALYAGLLLCLMLAWPVYQLVTDLRAARRNAARRAAELAAWTASETSRAGGVDGESVVDQVNGEGTSLRVVGEGDPS